jgi:uncharacterized membrane protein
MLMIGVQAGLIIGLPALVLLAARRFPLVEIISPVLICYLLGLLLGNQGLIPMNADFGLQLSGASVAIAIPLLLFSVDLLGWMRLARATVLSFFLAVISATAIATSSYFIFSDRIPEASSVAGMLVGVYVGGTPNMAAIGTALGVSSELFVQLNATDVLVSAVYLLFLFTVAQRVYGLFLPPFPKSKANDAQTENEKSRPGMGVKQVASGLGLSLAIVATGVGVSQLFEDSMREATAILIITTLALGAASNKKLRHMPGTSRTGHYFLLMFCIAIGTTADFNRLMQSSTDLVLMTAFMLYGSVLLHLFLAWIFRIDRDTVIITSTAAITGPALIAPVAMALKNREVVVSGIASGLVGYSVGNYLGMTLAWLLS